MQFWNDHWKLMMGLILGVGFGLFVAFFPPALPFMAGLSVFGFTPFAFLTGLAPVLGSIVAGGIATLFAFAVEAVYNLMYLITSAIDLQATRSNLKLKTLEFNEPHDEPHNEPHTVLTSNSSTVINEKLHSPNVSSDLTPPNNQGGINHPNQPPLFTIGSHPVQETLDQQNLSSQQLSFKNSTN